MKLVALVVAAGVLGCTPPATESERLWSLVDSGSMVENRPWIAVVPFRETSAVIIEGVAYWSGELMIAGQLCRPTAPGPHPVIVHNHGGFAGIAGEWGGADGTFCFAAASLGFVVLQSSYRGEDGSDGDVEVCHGEVDDVLGMLAYASVEPFVDSTKVAALGASHGGCITLRAAQRTEFFGAAVAAVPPTDWAALTQFWDLAATDPGYVAYANELLADGNGDFTGIDFAELSAVVQTYVGGPPASVYPSYVARSPVFHVDPQNGTPLMVQHGVLDPLVPLTETCNLAAAHEDVTAYRRDPTGGLGGPMPAGCQGAGTWTLVDALDYSAPFYAGFYDGADHEMNPAMVLDAMRFIDAKLGTDLVP